MNYELAKGLKDAGWPQDGDLTCECRFDEIVKREPDGSVKEVWGKDHEQLCVPTLDELIEACGEGFFKLIKRGDDDWYAGDETNKVYAYGTTPTEAVAKLWLALNK